MTLAEVEERLRRALNPRLAANGRDSVVAYSLASFSQRLLVDLLRDIERARLLGLK